MSVAKSTYVLPKVKNRQHMARAASFKRIAKTLRIRATNYRRLAKSALKAGDQRAIDYYACKAGVLRDIAAEFDNEAATLRAMR